MIKDDIKLANWDIARTVKFNERNKVMNWWYRRLYAKDKRIKVTALGVIYLEKGDNE